MPRPVPVIDRVWTVLDLIRWGADYFREKGIDSPRLTIELLLCHVMQMKRVQLYTDYERPLGKDELATLRRMVIRRVEHEPLQYIIGTADFYGYAFDVTSDVLIPRPETELLVDRVVRHGKGQGPLRCLDIGTGSGCIAISCALQLPDSQWLATDVSAAALEVARSNAERLDVMDRITLLRHNVLDESLPGRFHVITMNPPYIAKTDVLSLDAEVRDHEPHRALTDDDDGLTFYRRMRDILPDILHEHGVLCMEIGFGQAEDVHTLMSGTGWHVDVLEDLSSIPRIVRVRHAMSM
jgi:release factor glutamine methyltransferase